jgi:serine/threonine protein kinase
MSSAKEIRLQQENAGLRDQVKELQEQVGKLTADLEKAEQRAERAEKARKGVGQQYKRLQKCVVKMLLLAVVGANVLAFKSARKLTSWCSFEVVGTGKSGSARRGMAVDPKTGKLVRTVVKVVDVSGAVDMDQGFCGLGSAMEPCITTFAAAALAKARAGCKWLAPAGAAGDAKGALLDLVMSMELKTLPVFTTETEDKLLQHLDQKYPRPAGGFSCDLDELLWVQERDAAAEQFLQRKGSRKEVCLVMVMREAEGGSLEQHVRKAGKGLNCRPGGALSSGMFMFLALVLCRQLAVLHDAGILLRDLKTGNVLLFGGLPKLADLDLSLSCAVLTWLQKWGFAGPNTTITTWVGTPGYVVEGVAEHKDMVAELVDLGKDQPGFEELAAADDFGLASTLLDLLTGTPRWSLVAEGSDNSLLQGSNTDACRHVPSELLVHIGDTCFLAREQLPQDVRVSLENVLRRGAPARERRAGLRQLSLALEGAMKERADLLGVTEAVHLSAQQSKLRDYINSS